MGTMMQFHISVKNCLGAEHYVLSERVHVKTCSCSMQVFTKVHLQALAGHVASPYNEMSVATQSLT